MKIISFNIVEAKIISKGVGYVVIPVPSDFEFRYCTFKIQNGNAVPTIFGQTNGSEDIKDLKLFLVDNNSNLDVNHHFIKFLGYINFTDGNVQTDFINIFQDFR